MFTAFAKRTAAQQIEARRAAHIAGLWANSNYDGSKEGENPRADIIKQVEQAYDDVIFDIYHPGLRQKIENEERKKFWSSPFIKGMKLPEVQQIDRDEIIAHEARVAKAMKNQPEPDIDQA